MVSTPLKNISQIGSFPPNRGENKKCLSCHHLVYGFWASFIHFLNLSLILPSHSGHWNGRNFLPNKTTRTPNITNSTPTQINIPKKTKLLPSPNQQTNMSNLSEGIFFWNWMPFLKLTANAPENRPKPTRKGSYSNHPFSGAKMLVSGRVCCQTLSFTTKERAS